MRQSCAGTQECLFQIVRTYTNSPVRHVDSNYIAILCPFLRRSLAVVLKEEEKRKTNFSHANFINSRNKLYDIL